MVLLVFSLWHSVEENTIKKIKKNNDMKKLIYLFAIALTLFMAQNTKAQSPIAVQNDNGTSLFATLDLAITNAVAGDYIYLPGGSFNISVPINKPLHIVGVGHNPDSCAVTGITQVTGSFYFNSGSDHGSITGLKISDGVCFNVSATEPILNYFSVERCSFRWLNLSTRTSNILINECVINGSITGNNTQNFQLSKCIVFVGIIGFQSNAYFINNIFPSSTTTFRVVNDCFFRNNIFIGKLVDPAFIDYNPPPSSINNLFQNNVFNNGFDLSTTSVSGTTTYVYNVFQNNITGPVSSLFVNQSGTEFDYKQDYHIKADSPAHHAGTDGTDLGIYGTDNPWKEGSLPNTPHIQSKSISTVNGNLNVKVKVAAQNN